VATQRQCAALLIERDDGHILFIKQSYGGRFFGFPGGVVEVDANPSEAALRETAEEVGVKAEIEYQIGTYLLTGGGWPDILAAVFKGRVIVGNPEVQDIEEISDIDWIKPANAPSPLLPDVDAALTDFVEGKRDVSRIVRRKVQMPEWRD